MLFDQFIIYGMSLSETLHKNIEESHTNIKLIWDGGLGCVLQDFEKQSPQSYTEFINKYNGVPHVNVLFNSPVNMSVIHDICSCNANKYYEVAFSEGERILFICM